MIELLETTQVRAFWFAGTNDIDLLACVLKQKGEAWTAVYRLRYDSGSGDPFDGSDEKNWYTVTTKDGQSGPLCEAMDMVAARFTATFGAEYERMDVDGDGTKAGEMVAARQHTHVREEPLQ